MKTLIRAALIVSLVGMIGGPSAAPPATASGSAPAGSDDASILEQIEATEHLLDPKVRHGDIEQWLAVVTPDYNEYDNYYPFLLEGHDAHRAIQGAWDQYDKPPPSHGTPPRRLTHLQVYGDVAITASYSVAKGDALTGGIAQLQQRHKITMVWVRTAGQWQLAFCNCEWVSTPDGLPYPH